MTRIEETTNPLDQMLEVQIGDVYKDLDPRSGSRKIEVVAIDSGRAVVRMTTGGPATRIRLDRLRPMGKRKGFELVTRKVG